MTYGPTSGWGADDAEYPEPQGYTGQPAYGVKYPPQAPRPSSGRNRWLIVGALVLVPVVLISAVLITVLLRRSGDAGAGGPLDGQLRNTYPAKPSPGWRLRADAVAPGANFVLPDAMAYTYRTSGLIDLDDLLVTSAVTSDGDRALLVGIDSATGAVRWTSSDVGEHPVCARKLIDGLLACLSSGGGASAPVDVSFLRAGDGTIDHRLQAPGRPSTLLVNGSDLYTVGYETMAKGTVDDLTKSWSSTYPFESRDSGCPGSGDSHYFGVNDNVVFYGSDTGVTVADTRDGRALTATDLEGVRLFGSAGFAGSTCAINGQRIDHTVQLVTPDGRSRAVDAVGSIAEPWLVRDPAAVPVVVGNHAYDLSSGREVWTVPGETEHSGLNPIKMVGRVLLGADVDEQHGTGPLTGYDIDTGEVIWTSTTSQASVIPLSDGARVMVRGSGSPGDVLTAVDLADGHEAWTLPVDGAVQTAGAGFVTSDGDTITFYPPTGGPSVAPGALSSETSEESGAGGPITKCGKRPELKPVEYRAESGGLIVKMEFKATCPGGDILGNSRFRITIRDGDSPIATGVFDFSDDPIILGGEGSPPTTVDLTFGSGGIWRLPNTLGDKGSGGGGGGGVVTTSKASGNEIVDCEEEGGTTGPSSTDQQPKAPTRAETTAGDDTPCADSDALNALRVQVDTDRPYVQSQLADRWIAQLSAKRPGLVAPEVDGRVVTWTPCEILRQHLRMRLQYPEVRLVWSDEWRTFDLNGWWVTFAGLTFSGPDEANGWCDQRGIPVDECFAKVVSNNRDSSGTTKYRR